VVGASGLHDLGKRLSDLQPLLARPDERAPPRHGQRRGGDEPGQPRRPSVGAFQSAELRLAGSIRHACQQDYPAFFNDELEFRKRMHYPPALAMINVIVRSKTRENAMSEANELVRALRWGGEPYKVLGPAPAPLSRLKGEHRVQFFIKGTQRAAMRKALVAVIEARPEIRRRTIIDVDPMSVL